MNQKGFSKIIIVLCLISIVIIGIGAYFIFSIIFKDGIIVNPTNVTKLVNDTEPATQPTTPNSFDEDIVAISIDKTEYSKDEIIKIVVSNNLDKPILYFGDGDRFWGIEYFKNGKWVNAGYEEGGGFQLTDEKIGDVCYIVFYERSLPVELKSGSSLSNQWNQKICPFGILNPVDPKAVKYIGNGQYRLTFIYGFEVSSDDPYKLSNFQTVYSNIFTIK